MRPLTIVGIVVALIGVVITVRGLSVSTQREVLRVGDMQVTAQETRSFPPWSGPVLIVVGVLVAGAGLRGGKVG